MVKKVIESILKQQNSLKRDVGREGIRVNTIWG